MFIVRRPFKNLGKVHTVGSVITEPTSIKRFKGKLAEGKIIEVTEQTYEDAVRYFKGKFGVDIAPITVRQEGAESIELQESTEDVKVQSVSAKVVSISK